MNRRGFLRGILALGVAPAIVRASSLMQVKTLYPDGWIDALAHAAAEEMGFGMAQVKTEGMNVLYDNANFARVLWPGIREFWGKHYDSKVLGAVEDALPDNPYIILTPPRSSE